MKSFMIKIAPKNNAKNSITDLELDMGLANNEGNTFKEILSLEEISDSLIHTGEKKNSHTHT